MERERAKTFADSAQNVAGDDIATESKALEANGVPAADQVNEEGAQPVAAQAAEPFEEGLTAEERKAKRRR